jgi:hypothetical protein
VVNYRPHFKRLTLLDIACFHRNPPS